MIIRDVEDRDAEKIREYANEFMAYYPLKIEYDEIQLLQVLEHVSETGIFLVGEKDGEVVGAIGGMLSPHPYAPMHLMGTEMFLWVDKEHRKSTIGPRLLKAFEQKCKDNYCKYIVMTSTVHTPNFKKYLAKNNYVESETAYLKEI